VKTFHSSFWTPIAEGASTLAVFWHVLRYDGQEFGWAEHPYDIPFVCTSHDSPAHTVTYLASTGLEVSNTENTDTLAVPTVDVTAFLDVSTEPELLAGIWNGAEITIFEADYENMPTSFDMTKLHVMRFGRLGQVTLHDNIFRAELRGLTSRLETTIGRVTTARCPWKWGNVECLGTGDGGPPTFNVATFTHAGTITSVGSNPRRQFSASALTQPPGYFTLGTITFTSGANLGMPPMDIRSWRNKQFTPQRPLPYDVQVGDTFSATRGDDKTFTTCKTVFNNRGQYAGWLYTPGMFKLLQNDVIRERRTPPATAAPDGNPYNVPSGDTDIAGDDANQLDDGEGGPDVGVSG